MDQHASDDRLIKMRSVMSIRCLPKISPSSSTSPVHRLPPWGDLWREQMSRLELRIFVTVDGKNVRLTNSSPNPVQYDISPHRHSQLSDLTIRLHSRTSLKSISLKRWLYHQSSNCLTDQFNSVGLNHVINHILRSDWSIASPLTTTVTMSISM